MRDIMNKINEAITAEPAVEEAVTAPTNDSVSSGAAVDQKSEDWKNLSSYLASVEDEEEGNADEELVQGELPYLFKQEFPDADWVRLVDLPMLYASLKKVASKIFGTVTKTPLADIFCLSTMTGDEAAVHSAIEWIDTHGSLVDGKLLYTFEFLPGYKAHGKLFKVKNIHVTTSDKKAKTANVRFLVITDSHGEYIYAWAK